jgi:hypothetical protein
MLLGWPQPARGHVSVALRSSFKRVPLSTNWDIDYYQGGSAVVRNVVNRWSISPIIKVRSGLPFTITNGGVDANLDGVTAGSAVADGSCRTD